ncbi:hypothetical protein YPPY66_0603, partial [Yersinia pestis PY-66]
MVFLPAPDRVYTQNHWWSSRQAASKRVPMSLHQSVIRVMR